MVSIFLSFFSFPKPSQNLLTEVGVEMRTAKIHLIPVFFHIFMLKITLVSLFPPSAVGCRSTICDDLTSVRK